MEAPYVSRRVSMDTFHRNFYQSDYGKWLTKYAPFDFMFCENAYFVAHLDSTKITIDQLNDDNDDGGCKNRTQYIHPTHVD